MVLWGTEDRVDRNTSWHVVYGLCNSKPSQFWLHGICSRIWFTLLWMWWFFWKNFFTSNLFSSQLILMHQSFESPYSIEEDYLIMLFESSWTEHYKAWASFWYCTTNLRLYFWAFKPSFGQNSYGRCIHTYFISKFISVSVFQSWEF